MKRIVGFLAILLIALLPACGQVPAESGTSAPPESRTLTVFAAASLTESFTELGKAFEEAHPGVSVTLNFAGSQTLSTQISEGAQADVFASANHTEMDKLVSAELVAQDTPQDFLTNKLIVILPADNPAGIQMLQDLARPGAKIVLAADTVPVGKYARKALENLNNDPNLGMDFAANVLANVVSNENDVKLVVAKVQLAEADAGIVYLSDSVAAPELKTIEIPDQYNVIAEYPIAVPKAAPQPELAADFIAFVLSADGQAILSKWGFTPVAR